MIGLMPWLHRFAIKLYGAEHVAVIGHGDGRLLERFDALEKLIDLVGAVQKTVFGMAVKMNETGMFHRAKSQLAQSQWRDNYFADEYREKSYPQDGATDRQPTKSSKIARENIGESEIESLVAPMPASRCPS